MLSERMLPLLWLRFVVIILFGIFVASKQMWVLLILAIALAGWTAFQIYYAMRH
ncbi:MAG: hypothetical protein SPI77_04965 [Corynebacterium sp.]|nr:hypothetical protein [Corynebacterium sp.]